MIDQSIVKFVYLSSGELPSVISDDTLYFDPRNKKIYVGSVAYDRANSTLITFTEDGVTGRYSADVTFADALSLAQAGQFVFGCLNSEVYVLSDMTATQLTLVSNKPSQSGVNTQTLIWTSDAISYQSASTESVPEVTSADDGKILLVANGAPTWADAPDTAAVLYVPITYNGMVYTSTVKYSELQAAIAANKVVIVKYNNSEYHLNAQTGFGPNYDYRFDYLYYGGGSSLQGDYFNIGSGYDDSLLIQHGTDEGKLLPSSTGTDGQVLTASSGVAVWADPVDTVPYEVVMTTRDDVNYLDKTFAQIYQAIQEGQQILLTWAPGGTYAGFEFHLISWTYNASIVFYGTNSSTQAGQTPSGKCYVVVTPSAVNIVDEPKELPSYTSTEANEVLKVNAQGDGLVWAQDESLPSSTSADAGKVLTVDNSGDAIWATPAGPNVFKITVTDLGSSNLASDKTYAQIIDAINAGDIVTGVFDPGGSITPFVLTLKYWNPDYIIFELDLNYVFQYPKNNILPDNYAPDFIRINKTGSVVWQNWRGTIGTSFLYTDASLSYSLACRFDEIYSYVSSSDHGKNLFNVLVVFDGTSVEYYTLQDADDTKVVWNRTVTDAAGQAILESYTLDGTDPSNSTVVKSTEVLSSIVPTPTSADAGKVLTVDNEGDATWQQAPSGVDVFSFTITYSSGQPVCDKTYAEILAAINANKLLDGRWDPTGGVSPTRLQLTSWNPGSIVFLSSVSNTNTYPVDNIFPQMCVPTHFYINVDNSVSQSDANPYYGISFLYTDSSLNYQIDRDLTNVTWPLRDYGKNIFNVLAIFEANEYNYYTLQEVTASKAVWSRLTTNSSGQTVVERWTLEDVPQGNKTVVKSTEILSSTIPTPTAAEAGKFLAVDANGNWIFASGGGSSLTPAEDVQF